MGKKRPFKSTLKNLFLAFWILLWVNCTPRILATCYPQSTPYGGGAGTAASPYLICSVTQLQNVDQNLGAYFFLSISLDLTNSNFTPLGSITNTPFSGVFDGGNNSLSNWSYTSSTAAAGGLFSFATGTIQNLNLINFQISTPLTKAGLITAKSTGVINNCTTSGSVVAHTAGGIAGSAAGTLTNCSSSANVVSTGYGFYGGLVGSSISPSLSISHSSASGNVSCSTANCDSGGLLGANLAQTLIVNSYFAGGIVQATGGSGAAAGGLVGRAAEGGSPNGITIQNSYSSGSVQSATGGSAGGAVGFVYSSGGAYLSLTNVYAAGVISGAGTNGGLVGLNINTASSTSSYWDTQITNQATSADSGGSGETTAAMQTQSTFVGWDFVNTWYPPVPGQSSPTLR